MDRSVLGVTASAGASLSVVFVEKWPVLGRHEKAAERLQVWALLGRAARTIDAYGRGLAEFPLVCERGPHTRALYADWDSKARAVVGNLRLAAGAHPDDPALATLIGKLILASPEFNTIWADHRVQSCATASYELHHPIVGTLTVTQQTLRSGERADQTIITCTAPQGSASAAALEILAHVAHQQARPTPTMTVPAPDPQPASMNSGEPSAATAGGVSS